FFFSSRRRHTRFSRDWSSDVCSSDLFKVDLNLTATRTENNRPLTTTIVSDMLRSNPTFPAYTDGEPTPTLSGDQFNALIREDLYSDFAYNNRILANVSQVGRAHV